MFLQVSSLSFNNGLGKSIREGYILQKFYDDYYDKKILSKISLMYHICKINDDRKWLVIKDSYIVPIKLDSNTIEFPMLIDQDFSVELNHGIRIKNLQRLLIIKSLRKYERDQWFDCLMKIKSESLFNQQHLFNSFAPKREKQYAQWFVIIFI